MLPWKPTITIPTPELAQAPTHIVDVGPNDVLMGRGTLSVTHEGNKLYRSLIGERLVDYMSCRSNEEKDIVARSIVEVVASRHGRFLEKVESPEQFLAFGIPENVKVAYVLAKEEVVLTKTKQCIRDTVKRSLAAEASHDDAKGPDHKKLRRQETETEDTKMQAMSSHIFLQNQVGVPAMGAASGFSARPVLRRDPMLLQPPPFAAARLDTSTMTTREVPSESQQVMPTGNLWLVQQELLRQFAGFSGLESSGNFPQYTRENFASEPNPPSPTWTAQGRPFALAGTPAGGLAYSSGPDSDAQSAGLHRPQALSANEPALVAQAILRNLNRNRGTNSLFPPQQESSIEPIEGERLSRDAATFISVLRQRAATRQQDASLGFGPLQLSQLPTPTPVLAQAQSLLRQYLAEQLSAAAANQHQQQPLPFHPSTTQQPLVASNSWLRHYDLASLQRAQQGTQLQTGNVQQRDAAQHFLVRLLLQQQQQQPQRREQVGQNVGHASMPGAASDAWTASAEANDSSSTETNNSLPEEVD